MTSSGAVVVLTATLAASAGAGAKTQGSPTLIYATPGGDVSALVSVRSAGGARRTLVKLKNGGFTGFDWSPDGRHVAYAAGSRGLFIVSATGGTARRIARGQSSDPAWSPNGHWVAFVRGVGGPGGAQSVAVVSPSGTVVHQVGPTEESYSDLSWSPGARRLLVTEQVPGDVVGGTFCPHVAVISLTGATARLPGPECSFEPEWSPRGDRIAYVASGARGNSIAVQASSGTGPASQLTTGTNALDPEWSPSGGTIAYTRFDAIPSVATVPAAGGASTIVVRGTAKSGAALGGWSPDGRRLAFFRFDPVEDFGGGSLFVLGPGRVVRRLARPVALEPPAWRPPRARR